MTDVKKPLPSVIALSKFSNTTRLSIGVLVLASTGLVTPMNRITISVIAIVTLLALKYKDFAVFVIGSIGQIAANGPRLTLTHAKNLSKWIVLDIICILFGVIATGLVLEEFNPLFTLITCSLFITIFNRTFQDQAMLNCSEEEFRQLYENYTETEGEFYREKVGKAVKVCEKEQKQNLKEYTWKEVQEHNTKDDLWMVANGLVYDLTPFYTLHPGGRKVLTTMAGRDCTDVLEVYHPANVFDVLPKYLIGRLTCDTISESSQSLSEADSETFNWKARNEEIMKEYRKSRQVLLKLGLFETDLDYYTIKFLFNGVLLAVAVYLNFYSQNVALYMISAVLIGVVWQQMAFVGHDLGHTAVSHKRNVDYSIASGVGTLLGGISIAWWKYSHNVHHINCNSVHDDSDIQHMPVFAVHESMLSSFYSRFHNRMFVFDRIAKFLLSYQHYLYYPIMAVARVNLYLQSLIFFAKNPRTIEGKLNYDIENKFIEFFCLLGFFGWYGLLVANLPSIPIQLASFLVTHAVAGVLHIQICISHFSMHSYGGRFNNQVESELLKTEGLEKVEMEAEKEESEENWMLLQMRTTMDVNCPRYMDFFHGGLQYQVIHHLYPRLPRHNERLAQTLVRHIAGKYNIEYRYLSFYESNRDLVSHLKVNALEARKRKVDCRDFTKSEIYEAMNLIG